MGVRIRVLQGFLGEGARSLAAFKKRRPQRCLRAPKRAPIGVAIRVPVRVPLKASLRVR